MGRYAPWLLVPFALLALWLFYDRDEGSFQPVTNEADDAPDAPEIQRERPRSDRPAPPVVQRDITTTIGGHVANLDGKGIPGSRIKLVSSDQGEVSGECQSGADGAFTLTIAGRAPEHVASLAVVIAASADGYVTAHSEALRLQVARGLDNVTLTLRSPGIIQGAVTLAGSKTRATVILALPGKATRIPMLEAVESCAAGDDGVFRFADVAPGEYTLLARPAGLSPEPKYPKPKDGDTSAASVRLDEGRTISGIALELAELPALLFRLEPKVAAPVRASLLGALFLMKQASFPSVAADSNGVYRVEGITPDIEALCVEAPGYSSVIKHFDPRVSLGDIDLGVIELETGALIDGRVVNESGAGIADVNITLRYAPKDISHFATGNAMPDAVFNVKSDAQGAFRFEHLAPGRYEFVILQSDTARLKQEITVAAEDLHGVTLTLVAGGVLHGKVKFPASAATKDESAPQIVVVSVDSEFADFFDSSTVVSNLIDLADFKGMAGADGRYEIRGLPAGEYHVAAGIERLSATKTKIKVESGHQTEVNFDLGLDGTVLGRVHDKDGRPMTGVTVQLAKGDEVLYVDACDNEGHYQINGVAPGTYDLRIEGEPSIKKYNVMNERWVQVAVDGWVERDLVFYVSSGAVIRGRVLLDGEAVFTHAMLYAQAGQDSATGSCDKEQGTFELSDIAPGTYTLSLRSFGDPRQSCTTSETIEIKPGDTEVLFERNYISGDLGGTVIVNGASSGYDYRRVRVTITSVSPGSKVSPATRFPSMTHCDEKGQFNFPRLVAGEYLVTVIAHGYVSVEERCAVTKGSTINIVIGESAASIVVTVKSIAWGALKDERIAGFARVRLLDH
ncbi:MAG: carboxypeptidase-like regulatory domain-containing protein, partial [Planctomycetes bacterium]|nr:carboxypeptidase-like regulatory domain-containing protein [Planctomycetota bacterium]